MPELTIREIEKAINKANEDQAVMINNEFEAQKDHFDQQLIRIEAKLDKALYTDLTHLEARVTMLEHKTSGL